MNFNSDSTLRENMLTVVVRENKSGLQRSSVPESLIRERLRDMLACRIAGTCVKITEEQYSTEYRVEVFVLTADQLERQVHERSLRLSSCMPSVYVVGDKPFD